MRDATCTCFSEKSIDREHHIVQMSSKQLQNMRADNLGCTGTWARRPTCCVCRAAKPNSQKPGKGGGFEQTDNNQTAMLSTQVAQQKRTQEVLTKPTLQKVAANSQETGHFSHDPYRPKFACSMRCRSLLSW
eukprot:3037473-Amphidinium_carterae.1